MSLPDIDRQVLVLALARMVDAVGNSFLIVVLPLYIASEAITPSTLNVSDALLTGLVLSMFGLFNSVVQPFAGRASDRAGKRKIFVLIGLAILTVTNGAFAFVSSELSLLAIRIAQGIGVAFTIPATLALVNELSTTATRGGSMGVFNTFRLLGFGAGPIAAGAVVSTGPYRFAIANTAVQLSGFDAAFFIAAVTALGGFLLVTLFVSDPASTHADAGDDLTVSVLADAGDEQLLDSVFTLGVATLVMAISIALISTIQPAVNTRLDQGPTLFGIEFGVFVLVQVVLQVPIGSASDRHGRKPFIVWGLALLVLATFAQGLVVTPWQMIAARAVQGVAAAFVFAPALALAGDLANDGQSGTTLAVLTMAFGLGTALGPLSSGFLIQYGFLTPFAFGAALAAVGAILVSTQVEETVTTGPTATTNVSDTGDIPED